MTVGQSIGNYLPGARRQLHVLLHNGKAQGITHSVALALELE